ncbi:hypothetical protein CPLU01_01876 [Colletotrichum plurivorum]|uniref:Uncharacterized protein n=1 Tax=Colletotrichum plurivorum TaxID=2175906 RepID=A0A8H6KYW9_9PEZI|nr:hypothetical protein CPLU01_01876 [Colletotrichum plurivorum]
MNTGAVLRCGDVCWNDSIKGVVRINQARAAESLRRWGEELGDRAGDDSARWKRGQALGSWRCGHRRAERVSREQASRQPQRRSAAPTDRYLESTAGKTRRSEDLLLADRGALG